jgi:hypothetical protein
LVKFSQDFNNNFIILSEREKYPGLDLSYYYYYTVELLVDYNKRIEKNKILSDKNKEIMKIL